MSSAFYVQQRDERDWAWKTVSGAGTQLAATRLAEELRRAVDDLPHRPALPVRVVSAGELADEIRISRAAAEMLRRGPARP